MDRENLLARLTNLILNPATKDSERQIFLVAKQELESGKAVAPILLQLVEGLRQEAVANINQGSRLSPAVAAFYDQYASQGKRDKELGHGLIFLVWSLTDLFHIYLKKTWFDS